MSITRELLRADVSSLTTRIRVQPSNDLPMTQEITGNCVLSRSIQVTHESNPGLTATVKFCRLWIRAIGEMDETYSLAKDFLFLSLDADGSFPNNVNADLYLAFPKDVFSKLAAGLVQQSDSCYVYFYLAPTVSEISAEQNCLNIKAYGVDLSLESKHFSTHIRGGIGQNRYQHIVDEAVLTKLWPMRYRIGTELASSLSETEINTRTVNPESILIEIMDGLRDAFHPNLWAAGDRIPPPMFFKILPKNSKK